MQGPEGLLYWYTTSAILAILTIWNALSKLAKWQARRTAPAALQVRPIPGGSGSAPVAQGVMQGRDGIEEVALPTLSAAEPAISISRRPSSNHDPLSAATSIKSNGDGNFGHGDGGNDGEDRERQDGQSSGSKADTETAQPLYAGLGRSGNDSVSKSGRQVSAALGMAWNKYVLLAEMPIPIWDGRKKRVKWGKMSGTEAVWNAGYVLGVLVLSFQSTTDVKSWADQAGWVAVAQIPMIIALAGKNNLISFLTGISYERLNFLHRSAGKVCLAGSWIHAGGYLYLLGGIDLIQLQTSLTTWVWMASGEKAHKQGITSLMSFSLMYVCSLQVVRRKIYEFFLVSHICLASLFLGGVIMHWNAVSIWIYPGIGLWAADRLIRILRLIILNSLRRLPPFRQPATQDAAIDGFGSGATLTLLTPSTMKLSFPAPFPWNAGQHFYILVPGMSRMPWELHPFTAATVPGDKGELAFIIRVRDGFTRRMKEKVDLAKRARGLGADEECSIRVTGAVEGPYGHGEVLSCHEAVVIFAGGSGVSFALAHLLQIITDARWGHAATRLIKIIWMVKSRLHLNWISPILLAHTHQLPLGLTIELHVHVTKRYNTTLPADPEMATVDWRAYMEQRMAQPRRDSMSYGGRKMSTMSWATFADDSEDVSGPGTRRGSEYVIRGERVRRRSTRPALPSLEIGVTDMDALQAQKEASGEVLRTFTWNDGYNSDALPLEDQDSTKRSSIDSAPASHRSPGSSISNVNWGARAETPRRKVSFADDSSLHSQSRRSLESPIHSPSPRRISLVSMDELQGPPLQPRRRSSGMSAKRKASLQLAEMMPEITEMSPRVEMSPTVDAPLEVPVEADDGLKVDFRKSSFAAHRETALRPPPLAFDMQRSASAQSNASTGPLDALRVPAADMSRSSSVQSATSFSSLLQTGSGVITPALSEAGNTFADTEDSRRRQSLGLEGLVHWHEGRANPREIIQSAKQGLQLLDVEGGVARGSGGGKVQVLVCGPTSLMTAVRDAAKAEMDVAKVLRGGVAVGFHSENFGW